MQILIDQSFGYQGTINQLAISGSINWLSAGFASNTVIIAKFN